MKVIEGELTETRFTWPNGGTDLQTGSDSEKELDQKVPNKKSMKVSAEATLQCNEVTYISDDLGLHRVGNKTSQPAVSLHLYTPPYSKCKLFDESTGHCHPSANCLFFSQNGQKL
jgi:cysteine dioxygenase